MQCPCGTNKPYAQCCGIYHGGIPAPTPEALMRSRYTAFVLFDAAYLHRTHAPETRPSHYELDCNIRFFALKIHEARDNYVEFSAHYLQNQASGTPTPHVLRERSKFRKEGNHWFYVDGIFKN